MMTVDTKMTMLFMSSLNARWLLSTGRTVTRAGSNRDGLTYWRERTNVIAVTAILWQDVELHHIGVKWLLTWNSNRA